MKLRNCFFPLSSIRIFTALLLIIGTSVSNNVFAGHYFSNIVPLWTFQNVADGTTIPVEERKIVWGARSRIRRTSDEVCMTTRTRSLPAGAYTNWWIIFNNPAACGDGSPGFGGGRCGVADFGNPEADASAIWATGNIVGPKGKGLFDVCVQVGGDAPGQVIFGRGLQNSQAEIHASVKWHEAASYADPLALGNQLTSISGGCEVFIDTDFSGLPNCPDPQIAIHPEPK